MTKSQKLAVELEQIAESFAQGKISYDECDQKAKAIWKEAFKLKINHNVMVNLAGLTEGDWTVIRDVLADI